MTETRKPGDELAEDMLGFGGRDVLTAKDLLLRPAAVLRSWMEGGPDGGGLYARPLRLYLALNAILMLILFLRGGAGFVLDGLSAAQWEPLLDMSGKSRDAFVADADGWMTLVMVPILSAFYAIAAAPLLRWWDPDDLGWRRGFRAAFGWLCAWTVPVLPLSAFGYGSGPLAAAVGALTALIGVVAFVRMGPGRWFQSPLSGVLKGVALMIAVQLSAMVGGVLVGAIGIVGALVSP
ncbi:hypothetical protein [Brevundimonas sp. NIBR11]|uniref:hypothetical protein n=1 Tax=Brevundimonas sp. NIBR11 TaxID=3015999 RepID=UPI0022F0264F|nr:hypothetical protein [Brevundimonas sp. NIBR11]WGM31950.1 hypothetical protein KKHFBJBL_02201 [Brevundimonas sp. NIBR11]